MLSQERKNESRAHLWEIRSLSCISCIWGANRSSGSVSGQLPQEKDLSQRLKAGNDQTSSEETEERDV